MRAAGGRRHIVLFTGQSSYGVLSHLTSDLARAFTGCGWSAEVVDLGRLSIATEMRRVQREGGASFFCAYSGYGSDMMVGDRLLYDVIGVPYVGLMLDNPCYFPERHLRASDNLLYLHGDDGHHDVSVDVSPRGSWRGVFRLASTPWDGEITTLAERRIPALFASKGGDPVAYESTLRRSYHGASMAFILDVADMLGGSVQPQRVWDVARERLALTGIRSGASHSVIYHGLVRHADHLARLRRATAVARALLPLPVTFVGGEWGHVSSAPGRATFLPPAPLPAVRRMMADSRVVLNVQPGTTDSMHDRFVLGMHAGAAVVSDTNRFIDASIGRDAFVPWIGEPGSIADVVADALARPADVQGHATRGLTIARDRLTTGHMAATILRAVGQYQALLPPLGRDASARTYGNAPTARAS